MIVYKAVNKINGKTYVGQTVSTLEHRIAQHLVSKKSGFPQALKKYGIQSFEFSVIDSANSLEILNAKEVYWIRQYDCRAPRGYNLTDGGLSGNQGLLRSEETCKKLREAKLRNPVRYWLGRKRPDVVERNKNNNPMNNPETIKKMSKSKTGKPGPWAGKKRPDLTETWKRKREQINGDNA